MPIYLDVPQKPLPLELLPGTAVLKNICPKLGKHEAENTLINYLVFANNKNRWEIPAIHILREEVQRHDQTCRISDCFIPLLQQTPRGCNIISLAFLFKAEASIAVQNDHQLLNIKSAVEDGLERLLGKHELIYLIEKNQETCIVPTPRLMKFLLNIKDVL